MSNETNYGYRNGQMVKACPFPLVDQTTLKIQLRSEHGKSNYMDVTPQEWRLIELVLGGLITDEWIRR